MPDTPDVTDFAASVLHLIQRFTGNQPDALAQMRTQVENELSAGREMVARAEAQLAAIDQLQALIDQGDAKNAPPRVTFVPINNAPPLKTAILRVLAETPGRWWDRDDLYAEVTRRGWGPGGTNQNPRNTFTARLRDLEKAGGVRRRGESYTSKKNEEVPAM